MRSKLRALLEFIGHIYLHLLALSKVGLAFEEDLEEASFLVIGSASGTRRRRDALRYPPFAGMERYRRPVLCASAGQFLRTVRHQGFRDQDLPETGEKRGTN